MLQAQKEHDRRLQDLRELTKKQQEELEMKECTFQPNLESREEKQVTGDKLAKQQQVRRDKSPPTQFFD